MSYSCNKLLLIGGIPSSGSTRLVRILSESPHFFCLPETGLFTKGYQLNREREYIPSHVRSEVEWIDVCAKAHQSLGIFISQSEIENEIFCPQRYLLNYFSPGAMGKVVVEKTPENIFAFDYYLSASKEHKVLVTTRDVRGVCASLLKRGISYFDAILIWYSHAYEAWHLMNKYPQQVLHLPYSFIVAQADKIPEMVMNFYGKSSVVEDNTMTNYRHTLQEKEVNFSFNMSAKLLETRSWDSRIKENSQYPPTEFDIGLTYDSLISSFAFTGIGQLKPMGVMKLENMLAKKELTKEKKEIFQKYNYVEQPNFKMIEQLRTDYKAYFKIYE